MTSKPRVQTMLAWGVTAFLGVIAATLPRLLDLNGRIGKTGFFTPEAYGVAIALLVTGLIVGLVSRRDAVQRAALVGLGPALVSLWRMVLEGPGNLWPISLLLALMFGLPPALLGATIARAVRPFQG